MAQNSEQNNQTLLFSYFLENSNFSYSEAYSAVLDHVVALRTNSIGAVVHESVDKGYFIPVSEGVYSFSHINKDGQKSVCLLINGDNRDLSMFADNSVDVIITDQPQYTNYFDTNRMEKSKKYSCVFDTKDYTEKQRILKPGRFIMEFLPQNRSKDYEQVCKIKSAARKGSFDYYAGLSWQMHNPGFKDTVGSEEIMLFSKGAPRDFYVSVKGNSIVTEPADNISLPTVFDYGKAYQPEKAAEIIAQILQFISADKDFDKSRYSDPSAIAEKSFRVVDNMVVEKNPEKYHQLSETIAALKEINIATKNLKVAINVAIDALEAFYEGPEAFKIFEKHQLYFGMPLQDAAKELIKLPEFKNEKLRNAVVKAIKVLQKEEKHIYLHRRSERYWEERRKMPRTLECSARGDRRFSSSHVKLKINGTEKTIESWYHDSKRDKDGVPVSRGAPYEYLIDPFTGDKLTTPDEYADMYSGLWIAYLSHNPDLVQYASKFSIFKDSCYSPITPIKTSEIIAAYVTDKDRFTETIKAGKWYKNVQSKRKPALDKQLEKASNNNRIKVNLEDKESKLIPTI